MLLWQSDPSDFRRLVSTAPTPVMQNVEDGVLDIILQSTWGYKREI